MNHSTTENMEDKRAALIDDLKRVQSDAHALLAQMATSTVDEFADAEAGIKTILLQAQSSLGEALQAVGGKARLAGQASQAYVHDKPWHAIGFAATTGLIIGFLLARR
ncbi:DUF883 family protein [Paludibacterium yongneupense]|uniref:DUF883 family protein n=2 Tax=Paludibacterium yongneupense TaxID=400061 RepID=UPI0004907B6D|nr:DUF883 family protein [Paludibacterium yongneupense]